MVTTTCHLLRSDGASRVKKHQYEVSVTWTGNTGSGTSSYRAYERAHEVRADGKPPIAGSSDPSFRGDTARRNPEELLVVSLSQCHMLWFLHLCAVEKQVVTAYEDGPPNCTTARTNCASSRTR